MDQLRKLLSQLEKHPALVPWYDRIGSLYEQSKKWFGWLWLVIVGFAAVGTLVYFVEPRTYVEIWFEVGKKLGTFAVLVFLLTLIPGILKRFELLPRTGVLLGKMGRELGITVFYLALSHQWLVRFVPVVLETGSFLPITIHVLAGMSALTVFFIMWLASNDLAFKKLGKWWKLVHKLSYVALSLVLLHVALAGERATAFLILVVAILEIASWIRALTLKKPPAR